MKRTIESLTPPADKQVMWLDISQEVKQLKALGGIEYREVYATDDPSLYSDSDYSKMRLVGMMIRGNGYTREWDLGNTAEIVPIMLMGNATIFKCDYCYSSNSDGVKILLLGGEAYKGSQSGLGYFDATSTTKMKYNDIGFRSSCVVDKKSS